MDMHEIEDQLLQIIHRYTEQLPAEQLKEMADLVQAGEPGIGFENLCTQLHEYDVAVDNGTLRQLEDIGTRMGLAPKNWLQLQQSA